MTGLSRGYEPRWDIDFADGYQGELFAQWALRAIVTGASVEIKTDRESWRTGNLYIEQECRVSGQWVPSGIDARHTQSLLWAHLVAGPAVLFAPVKFVRYVAERNGKPRECSTGSHPTRGKVLPIGEFVALLTRAARVWVENGAQPALGPGADDEAPFGRKADGQPLAPWGFRQDGRVRLQPGGRRPAQTEPDDLWNSAGGGAA